MPVRGIRGAIDCSANRREEVIRKTRKLLSAMVDANGVEPDAIACAIFTMTPDLNADFPASAGRGLGWSHVPMLCAAEIAAPKGMKRVIRVLLLVDSRISPRKILHQYLGRTAGLRPDLVTRKLKKKTGRKK